MIVATQDGAYELANGSATQIDVASSDGMGAAGHTAVFYNDSADWVLVGDDLQFLRTTQTEQDNGFPYSFTPSPAGDLIATSNNIYRMGPLWQNPEGVDSGDDIAITYDEHLLRCGVNGVHEPQQFGETDLQLPEACVNILTDAHGTICAVGTDTIWLYNGAGSGWTAEWGLNQPRSSWMDPQTGQVFVADTYDPDHNYDVIVTGVGSDYMDTGAPADCAWYSMYGASATDVYAVGRCPAGYGIAHWNGSAWTWTADAQGAPQVLARVGSADGRGVRQQRRIDVSIRGRLVVADRAGDLGRDPRHRGEQLLGRHCRSRGGSSGHVPLERHRDDSRAPAVEVQGSIAAIAVSRGSSCSCAARRDRRCCAIHFGDSAVAVRAGVRPLDAARRARSARTTRGCRARVRGRARDVASTARSRLRSPSTTP